MKLFSFCMNSLLRTARITVFVLPTTQPPQKIPSLVLHIICSFVHLYKQKLQLEFSVCVYLVSHQSCLDVMIYQKALGPIFFTATRILNVYTACTQPVPCPGVFMLFLIFLLLEDPHLLCSHFRKLSQNSQTRKFEYSVAPDIYCKTVPEEQLY